MKRTDVISTMAKNIPSKLCLKWKNLKDNVLGLLDRLDAFTDGITDENKIRIIGVFLGGTFFCFLACLTAIETDKTFFVAACWLISALALFAPAKYLELRTPIPYIGEYQKTHKKEQHKEEQND